jgi:hypothetical protein
MMSKVNIRWWTALFALLVLGLQTASATKVDLSVDRDIIMVGERIEVTLSIQAESKISGQLTVINLDEKRQDKLLIQSSKPSCCGPDLRISGEFTDKRYFTAVKPGNYQVRAYFDRVEKTVNFTVKPEPGQTTTTTTLKPIVLTDYVELEWSNLDKCRGTHLGNMNSLNVEIGGQIAQAFGEGHDLKILYECGGSDGRPVDQIFYRGGNTGQENSIMGSYQLMVRCGRNALINDLKDCEDLRILLDMTHLNLTQDQINDPQNQIEATTTSSTSTTLADSTTTTIEATTTTIGAAGVPTEDKRQSLLDGCPCDWAPLLIFLILIFLILADFVYKRIRGDLK